MKFNFFFFWNPSFHFAAYDCYSSCSYAYDNALRNIKLMLNNIYIYTDKLLTTALSFCDKAR